MILSPPPSKERFRIVGGFSVGRMRQASAISISTLVLRHRLVAASWTRRRRVDVVHRSQSAILERIVGISNDPAFVFERIDGVLVEWGDAHSHLPSNRAERLIVTQGGHEELVPQVLAGAVVKYRRTDPVDPLNVSDFVDVARVTPICAKVDDAADVLVPTSCMRSAPNCDCKYERRTSWSVDRDKVAHLHSLLRAA